MSESAKVTCTAEDLIKFRDAVAEDVARQYPHADYIECSVQRSIEEKVPLIGWTWWHSGLAPNKATNGKAGG